MDLSLRASASSGLADAEVMEQNLQEWIIHRCVGAWVRACVGLRMGVVGTDM